MKLNETKETWSEGSGKCMEAWVTKSKRWTNDLWWKEAYRKILSRRTSAWIFIEIYSICPLRSLDPLDSPLYTNLTTIQDRKSNHKWRCRVQIGKFIRRGSTGKEITIFKLSLSIRISFSRSLLLFIPPPSSRLFTSFPLSLNFLRKCQSSNRETNFQLWTNFTTSNTN